MSVIVKSMEKINSAAIRVTYKRIDANKPHANVYLDDIVCLLSWNLLSFRKLDSNVGGPR